VLLGLPNCYRKARANPFPVTRLSFVQFQSCLIVKLVVQSLATDRRLGECLWPSVPHGQGAPVREKQKQ